MPTVLRLAPLVGLAVLGEGGCLAGLQIANLKLKSEIWHLSLRAKRGLGTGSETSFTPVFRGSEPHPNLC